MRIIQPTEREIYPSEDWERNKLFFELHFLQGWSFNMIAKSEYNSQKLTVQRIHNIVKKFKKKYVIEGGENN